MAIHVVQPGECLTSIAAQYGLTMKKLQDLPDNAHLKDLKRHPNILAPGDKVTIPDAPPHTETCGPNASHSFVAQIPKAKLKLMMKDAQGKGMGGKRFIVTVAGKDLPGTTTGDGALEVDIPPQATSARLQLWFADGDGEADLDRTLAIGHLDPVDMITGVQSRLQNLGFGGHSTGTLEAETFKALRAFRAKNKMPDVEDDAQLLDDAVRDKLRTQHEGG